MADNEVRQESVILAKDVDKPLTEEALRRDFGHAKIVVIGVGGAGCNAVNQMIEDGIKGISFVGINTDAQALSDCRAPVKILLGKSGLGAGGDSERGKREALDTIDLIRSQVKGADMVFVAAGMGGGTGTGAAPIVAKCALDAGALTVAVVTKPFNFEGTDCATRATRGLTDLREVVDAYIVVSNNKVLVNYGKKPSDAAYKESDGILSKTVSTIVDLVNEHGRINVDFADIRTILHNAGLAVIGFGDSTSEHRAEEAALAAISATLLETAASTCARVLVNITCSPDTTLDQVEAAVETIKKHAKGAQQIIFGQNIDERLKKEIMVAAVCTAFPEETQADSVEPEGNKAKKPEPTPADILPQFISNLLSGSMTPLQPAPISSVVDAQKLAKAQARIDELTSENAKLNQVIHANDNLQRKVDALSSSAKEAQAKYLEVFTAKAALERDLETARNRVSALNADAIAWEDSRRSYEQRIAELENQITNLNDRMTALQTSQASVDNSILAEREKELEEAKEEIARLNQQHTSDQESNEKMQADLTAAQEKAASATANFDRERTAWQQSLNENQVALSAAKDELAALHSAQEKLKAQLAEASSAPVSDADSELAELRQELNLLKQDNLKSAAQSQSQLDALNAQLTEVTSQRDDQVKRAESYQQRLILSFDEANKLKDQVAGLTAAKSDYEARIQAVALDAQDGEAALNEQIANLEKERDAAVSELRRRQDELQAKLDEAQQNQTADESLKRDLEAAKQAVAKLQEEIETYKATVSSMEDELYLAQDSQMEAEGNQMAAEEELSKFKEEFEAKLKEFEQSQTDRETLKTDLETARHEIAKLQEELETSKTEASKVQDELNSVTEAKTKAEADLAVANEELTRRQDEFQAQLDQAQQNQADGESLKGDLESAKQEIAKLQEELETSKTETSNVQNELNSVTEAKTKVEADLAVANQELAKLQDEFQTKLDRAQQNQADGETLKNDLEVAKQEINKLKEELEASKADASKIQDELSSTQEAKAKAEANLAAVNAIKDEESQRLQSELEATKSQLTSLQNEKDEALKQLDAAKTEREKAVADLNDQLAKAQSEAADLKASREASESELKRQIDQLKEDNEAFKTALDEANSTIADLNDTIEDGDSSSEAAQLEEPAAEPAAEAESPAEPEKATEEDDNDQRAAELANSLLSQLK